MPASDKPVPSSTGAIGGFRDGAAFLRASPRTASVAVAIAAAWSIAGLAEVSGTAVLLHHHTLIEHGPPVWMALPAFLVGWQVMVVAMMLPASMPAIAQFGRESAGWRRPWPAMAAFLAGYAVVWTAYGAAAFVFDVGLHRLADATPWLGDRPWLIEGTAVLAAAAYQFVPLKLRSLDACREPGRQGSVSHGGGHHDHDARMSANPTGSGAAARVGLVHALYCVVSSWALMLLMFAAGFANVWWMAALAAAMVFETLAPNSRRAAHAIGFVLLGLAVLILALGRIPAFVGT